MKRTTDILAIDGGEPVSKETILIHKPVIEEDDSREVLQSLRSTFVSGDGPDCRRFEEALKKYLGVQHAFFTNSCTGALEMAYRIKNFSPGSEVIVPNFTYTSTALAPLLNNLKIVLADVYAENGNIDVSKIEELITEKTVAISPVDYAGNPAEMAMINSIAKKHNLYVVHDVAQSLGSVYRGQKTGTIADVSCFSFHGTKNITTGEGGALVTDDDDIASKVRIARDKGTDKWSYVSNPLKKGFYEYVDYGNSYVQSNILGALGCSQLKKIDKITQRRRDIAEYYFREFKNTKGIRLPTITSQSEVNWHIFYLLVPPDTRDWFIDALRAEGIGSNIHYAPLHMNSFYRDIELRQDLSSSVSFFNRLVRIPLYPDLSDTEIEKITMAVNKIAVAFKN